MLEDNNQVETKETEVQKTTLENKEVTEPKKEEPQKESHSFHRDNREGGFQRRKPWRRHGEESDLKEEVVTTSRISKTTKGGKRLRFNVVVVSGDEKGRVGYGTGKAKETRDAIEKAKRKSSRSLIVVPLVKNGTITHEVTGRAGSTKVQLRPAKSGKGIVAGGPVRVIMQLAGVENISTKIHGPKNKLNAIRATFDAIKQLETKEQAQERRMMDINWMKPAPVEAIYKIDLNRMRKFSKDRKRSFRDNKDNKGGK